MLNGVFHGGKHLLSGLKVTVGQIVVALVGRCNGGIKQKQDGDQNLQRNNGLHPYSNGLFFQFDIFHGGFLSQWNATKTYKIKYTRFLKNGK